MAPKRALTIEDQAATNRLGTPTAKVYVIEFQKRGLPHAHILFILKSEDKSKMQRL